MERDMKELDITLHNGERIRLIEKAVDNITTYSTPDYAEVLGVYDTRIGEIDFEVKEEWVESKTLRSLDGNGLMMRMTVFKDYSEKEFVKFYHFRKSSFESLLKSETEKAFPLNENQHGKNLEEAFWKGDITANEWRNNEEKVLPEKFIVLLIK